MAHGAEHHRQLLRPREIVDAGPGLIDNLQVVHPDVPFGVPLGLLRASDEREELGKQPRDDSEVERQREADGWPRREQQLLDFAPDALGRQVVERDGPAQLARVRVELEPEAGGELDGAQDAQAVLGERLGVDGAQEASLQVALSVVRIEILPGQRIPADGVDPEVAPPRGFFERHVRIARDLEPAMSASGFRFAARQRDVDVAGLVDLKALADGFDAAQPLEQRAHAVGRQAEHLEIDVRRRLPSHQPIADPAADDERAAADSRGPPRRWRGRDRRRCQSWLARPRPRPSLLTGWRPYFFTSRSQKPGAIAFSHTRPRDFMYG